MTDASHDSPDGSFPVPQEARAHLAASPAERAQREVRTRSRTLSMVRLVYLVLLVFIALLPFVANVTDNQIKVTFADYWVALIMTFLFGAMVLVLDALTPNRRLATLFALYLGLIVGLVAALAISPLIDLMAKSWNLTGDPWDAYTMLIKLAIGITICYLTISTILSTKDDFRLVIPYIEFARQVRGVRPLLLDTSVLIDGRIERFGESGFLDAPVIVPQFVVNELQTLADSGDKLKRARGRRGLDILGAIQVSSGLDVTIDATDPPGHSVDHKLLEMAAEQNMRILTTDHNLDKVARIQGVGVLNLNDLAQTLRPQVLAGDHLKVEINKRGEGHDQGVGYLPDGTMVVVEGGSERVGQTLPVVVTNALQTSAGRMIFAQVDPTADGTARVERAAESATGQPRATKSPSRRSSRSPRNPRR